MDQQPYIPYREIAGKLQIQNGDVVLLTSDILRLAMRARKTEREFSAEAFLESFIEVLGPDGTLLIPAYNFDLENGDAYDISKTEPMTGSLAVAAMHIDGFIRTTHPLHSFLVSGKDAGLLSDLENSSSFGKDSPFAYLLEKNALLIFAGTTIEEAMTFTHFVEENEQVRYRRYKNLKVDYTDRKGDTYAKVFKLYAKKAGYTMALDRLADILPAEILFKNMINNVPFISLRCKDTYEIIGRDIRENNASSIAKFSYSLYIRDIIKNGLQRFNLFRTTYGKIRSAKRIY
ncbi:MAG: AAC(3) family N-acetyltransferase [Bacteroidales bacterium]|nr:AAC(3) family N-acetyltransferase [Bacteroidales bacterium]